MIETRGFVGLHAAVVLIPAVESRLGNLDSAADISEGLALSIPLLGGLELAKYLLGCVADACYEEVPSLV